MATTVPVPPDNSNPAAWRQYWSQLQQMGSLIPIHREAELLARLRSVHPGSYPFENFELHRADVEWVLDKHTSEGMRGPVDPTQEAEKNRIGPDLRKANLRDEDLHNLPLARAQMQCADLGKTGLGGADLRGAHLVGALLDEASLRDAALYQAHLEGATLSQADLEHANLTEAHLEYAILTRANLRKADLSGASFAGSLSNETHFESANLSRANLAGEILSTEAVARINRFIPAPSQEVPPADLRGAFLSEGTTVTDTVFAFCGYGPRVADVRWDSCNVAAVKWAEVKKVWDERLAHEKYKIDDTEKQKKKTRAERILEYEGAMRANRQLAAVLQAEGINEPAARFTWRAQFLQRTLYWWTGKPGHFLLSCLLNVLSGYGYHPRYLIWIYLTVVLGFADVYYLFQSHPSAWNAILLSAAAFHRLGLFMGVSPATQPIQFLTTVESLFGLVIEAGLIAAFTQRLLGR